MGILSHLVRRFATLGLPLALFGCYVDAGHGAYYDDGYGDGYAPYPNGPSCSSGVTASTIDTGVYYPLDPGLVGISAEYFGDGAWRFATACDTPVSGYTCGYLLNVVPVDDGIIYSVAPEDLEPGDNLGILANGAAHFDVETGADLDAFTLEATPGSTLEVRASLDGYCATSYLLWFSGGASPLATTGGVDLTPSSP
jgi:hypothetical protein